MMVMIRWCGCESGCGCDTDLKMWRILLTGDQVRLQVDLKFGMEVAT
ncbi:hypothetical protein HanXRQr2_Chr10g0442351 [Helianthus annuus]|uniref:Uncharacterized protein n=1 Tax=Helianthus annuus TaxID=4232 RepID=A0A9K3HYC5_HELAN|nr:hypothetical protein HanXRQr2_Chr10g0442351 [Helianthus annuus]